MPTIYIRDFKFAINVITAVVAILYICAWTIRIEEKVSRTVARGLATIAYLIIVYLRVLVLDSWMESYSDRAADLHIMDIKIFKNSEYWGCFHSIK